MITLLSYQGTENLGDAIQTLAMLNLIKWPCDYRERDVEPTEEVPVHLINGFLDGRWKPGAAGQTLFAGVYVKTPEIASKACKLANGTPIGARDSHSAHLLRQAGADVEFIGCATMTLPKYENVRAGVVHIDSGHPDQITQRIPKNAPWKPQGLRALERLLLLAQSELVITRRLHVALPCLAMGTPVQMPEDTLRHVPEPERLGILHELGFQFGKPQLLDLRPAAERFSQFVRKLTAAAVA